MSSPLLSSLPPPSSSHASSPALTPVLSPKLKGRVLLVEDNPVNRMVATEMLAGFGLEVETAEDGQDALNKLEAMPYDLVLMDCQMPVLDGYGATVAWRKKEIDESRARIPIAAITANALPSDRKRCLDCGMDDYLAKPYRRDELLGMLMKWLPTSTAG